ncbi:hypothetical protein CVV38_00060 [Candidatus Peregrinibacteria bacterium HGW-Peregrinibacteria-1]|jgi:5'(3')-deoxyribonucleotidase|nr:MAG: hypothetical protein CVV38_00060 [Candidatus Peregrinibacteria bacterium HGW-Peregrinibacteria-1]
MNAKSKLHVAVDLDEVVVDCHRFFIEYYNARHHTNFDPDGMTSYNYKHFMKDQSTEKIDTTLNDFYQTPMFRDLPFREHALEGLRAASQAPHIAGLHVVTARGGIAIPKTFEWIEQRAAGIFRSINFSKPFDPNISGKNKGVICEELGCNALIDDSIGNITECTSRGIAGILVTQPWNISHPTTKKYNPSGPNPLSPAETIRVNGWSEIYNPHGTGILNQKIV